MQNRQEVLQKKLEYYRKVEQDHVQNPYVLKVIDFQKAQAELEFEMDSKPVARDGSIKKDPESGSSISSTRDTVSVHRRTTDSGSYKAKRMPEVIFSVFGCIFFDGNHLGRKPLPVVFGILQGGQRFNRQPDIVHFSFVDGDQGCLLGSF